MKFRSKWYPDSSAVGIKSAVVSNVESSLASGQMEELDSKTSKVIDYFGRLVEMLYENGSLKPEQVKEFIPYEYEVVEE